MQSVLAIPFVIPTVPKAAAAIAPTADGGFLMSFTEDAADQPRTGEIAADATGMGSVAILPVPLVLVPESAGPDSGDALAVGSHSQGSGPVTDATLAGAPLGEVGVLGIAGSEVEQGWAVGAPGTDQFPSRYRASRAADGAAGEGPDVGEWDQTVAPGPPPWATQTEVAHASAAVAGDRGAIFPRDAAGMEETSDAGKPASDLTPALQWTHAGRIATGVSPVSNSGKDVLHDPVGSDPAMPTASAGHPGERAVPDADVAEARKTADPAGHPVPIASAVSPEVGVPGAGAAKDFRVRGQGAMVRAETGASDPPDGPSAAAENPGHAVAVSVLPGRNSLSVDALDRDLPGPQSPDLARVRESAPGLDPEPADRPRLAATASTAGFWERLFAGLSDAPSGDQALTQANAIDAQPVDDSGPDDDLAPAAQVSSLPVPSAMPDRVASSLAVFARVQAQLAAPVAVTKDEGETTDLAPVALSALSGTPVQSLALPHAAVAGPAHLPVPQVAAQITAALSQSADGATELALSPEELGKVRLRLERDAKHPDRMVVHITFERPETLDLFRRHAGELADALRDAGYAGADIGFGQEDSGAGTPDRSPASPQDYGFATPGRAETGATDQSPPRLTAGASLDLRL